MLTVTLTIDKDTATPALGALQDALRPTNLMPILVRSVSNVVRDHFDELESSRPNKLGAPRQHYYSGARQATSFTVDGDTATVHVAQVGMRLRYYGGTVNAGVGVSSVTGKPTKYLTIPVSLESYGHRAADFDDLKVLWGRNGPYGLGRVTEGSVLKGGTTQQVEVLYVLKASVDIPEDETMLPASEDISDALHDGFNRYVESVWRRSAA